MKKRMLSLLVAVGIAASIGIAPAAALEETLANTFRIHVTDAKGDPIEGVAISLYSYYDEDIVQSGETDADGSCTLYYQPDVTCEEGTDLVYVDYMVYAVKKGYMDQIWYLSKAISRDGADGVADTVNGEEIVIPMERKVPRLPEQTSYQRALYQYLRETGKLSDDRPFYIIQDEDRAELERRGITPTDEEQPYFDVAHSVRQWLNVGLCFLPAFCLRF